MPALPCLCSPQRALVADAASDRFRCADPRSFGFAVALADDVAVIGAYLADLPDGPSGSPRGNAGAAYVYRRKSDVFAATDKLTAPMPPATTTLVRRSLSMAGDCSWDRSTPISICPTARTAPMPARCTPSPSGETFRAQSKLIASDAGDRDALGRSVALSGNTALLAAPGKLLSACCPTSALPTFLTPLALGSPCSPATGALDCQSGFCADGVCCNSACGDGSADCQGCRGAETGRSDGECAPWPGGVVCRAKTRQQLRYRRCLRRSQPNLRRPLCPHRHPCRAREFCGECGPREAAKRPACALSRLALPGLLFRLREVAAVVVDAQAIPLPTNHTSLAAPAQTAPSCVYVLLSCVSIKASRCRCSVRHPAGVRRSCR